MRNWALFACLYFITTPFYPIWANSYFPNFEIQSLAINKTGQIILESKEGHLSVRKADMNRPYDIFAPYEGYPAKEIVVNKDALEEKGLIDAYLNVDKILKLLSNEFNFIGINGKGAKTEVILYSDDTAQFQQGNFLLGLNTHSSEKPAVSSLIDVVAHELFHGVIANTSKIGHNNIESAALNEGLSDVFGVYAKSKISGSKISFEYGIGTSNNGAAMRNISNPAAYHVVDHYENMNSGLEAKSGHKNSGIVGLAYYLLAEGGHHPRLGGSQIKGVGHDIAIQIFFKLATQKLKENATFLDARISSIELAQEYDSSVVNSVIAAWDAVGVK